MHGGQQFIISLGENRKHTAFSFKNTKHAFDGLKRRCFKFQQMLHERILLITIHRLYRYITQIIDKVISSYYWFGSMSTHKEAMLLELRAIGWFRLYTRRAINYTIMNLRGRTRQEYYASR